MNGTSWALLAEAELRKLLSRTATRVGLVVLLAIGVVVPALLMLVRATVEVGDGGSFNPTDFTVVQTLGYVLYARNFFVFRVLLIMLIALSVAGELVGKTLREDLLRPVSRAAVFAAKASALGVFAVLGVVLPSAVAGLIALVAFPLGEGFLDVLVQHALTLAGDLGFGALALAIALWVRSVSGTVVGVVLFLLLDKVIGVVLWGAESFRGAVPPEVTLPPWVDAVIAARPWLPSAAYDIYSTWTRASVEAAAPELPWQSVVSLILLTVGALAAAGWRLRTMDVD